MSNAFKGFNFYQSTFDPVTGVLVRNVEVPEPDKSYSSSPRPGTLVQSVAKSLGVEWGGLYVGGKYHEATDVFEKLRLSWARKYGRVHRTTTMVGGKKVRQSWAHVHDWRSERAFSPVPETIDVKITDWCNFGCGYCYMDSTAQGKHAPRELLTNIFDGLKAAPYQIAFGGGEPTAHPDFPWFLEYTKSKGTVPNYTTAGHILRDEVFEATNKYCGGVALTYHAFKGPEYFKKTYDTWRSRLDPRVQLNVHVLFDKDVADNLLDLQEIGLRDLNVVLLAYYPAIGRSNWEQIAPRGVYDGTLPLALKAVQESRFKIAFSEGLLPYFLSHQLPEVDTRFAGQQEGVYSCYVDDKGRVSHSSFDPPKDTDHNGDPADNRGISIYDTKFQKIWEKGMDVPLPRHFEPCATCEYESQCHVPEKAHYLTCKFAEHNKAPVLNLPERRRRLTVVA
jgi:MoaA/NifB/PqqE/SkfB family radical SAM enzyme